MAGTNASMGTTGLNASMGMNASAQGYQTYFNNQTSPLTGNDRAILLIRSREVMNQLGNPRMFIMPVVTLNHAVNASITNLYITDITRTGNAAGSGARSMRNAHSMPFSDMADNMNTVPGGRTIVVVGDNETQSVMAMAMLRMMGYNAWALQGGTAGLQQGS